MESYHFLKIGDLQIAYQEIGQGPPVLLVHGFGNSSYTWAYVVRKLPLTYRYILLDLPGFGKSDKPRDRGYRLIDQAAVLGGVIQALHLKGTILVGHSYGGAVVLTHLLAREGKEAGYVRGCVFINSLVYQQALPPLVTRLNIPLLSKLGIRFIPSTVLVKMSLKRDVFFDEAKIPDDLVEAYATALRSRGARQALLATARNLATKESPSLSKQLSTLAFPSLIIWGEEDRIVPLANAYRFAHDLPNSTLEILRNCGHAPQEECPSQTAELISDFLKRLYKTPLMGHDQQGVVRALP